MCVGMHKNNSENMSTCGFEFDSNGLTDMETLALFDDSCLDPASIVGSNTRLFRNSYSDEKSFMPEEHSSNDLEADEFFDNIRAGNFPSSENMAMSPSTWTPSQTVKSNRNFSSDEKTKTNFDDELYFLDITDFSVLNVKSEKRGDLKYDKIGHLHYSHVMAVERMERNNQTFLCERRKMATNDDGEFPMPKLYSCRYCKKHFYNKLALRLHHVDHAGKQLRCHRCKFRARMRGSLIRHVEYYHHCTPKRRTTHVWYDFFC